MPATMPLVPSSGVRPEGPVTRSGIFHRPAHAENGSEIGQVVVVVHVQVSNEDVVNARHRDAHGEDVLDAAGAEVEEEAVAVAKFDHDARAGLIAPGRERATADERDPHLVRPEGLTAGEVVHPAPDGRRWLVVWRELQAGARSTAVGVDGLVRAWRFRFFVLAAHIWLLLSSYFKIRAQFRAEPRDVEKDQSSPPQGEVYVVRFCAVHHQEGFRTGGA